MLKNYNLPENSTEQNKLKQLVKLDKNACFCKLPLVVCVIIQYILSYQ